ncbi:MAG: hypothetical protein KKD44_23305 [Proteobacteria bacterium]|nr:hypothetical protein [Pseudomonadota bacterium]
MVVQVRWTGAAGLEFFYDNTTLLIDPYYTRSGKKDVVLGRVRPDSHGIATQAKRIGKVSSIVVSHTILIMP